MLKGGGQCYIRVLLKHVNNSATHPSSHLPKRLSENAHLPFDRPFDKLTVLSKVEGLTALSEAEGLRYPHPRPVKFSLCETAKPI
jgi:hypothetical protein